MKKSILFFITCFLVIFLSSCRKSGVDLFSGDYTFKSSGVISIRAETTIDSIDVNIPASLDIDLSNDIGQLNISVADIDNNEVVVVINYLNGDVVVTDGTCDGDRITINEYKRHNLPISVNTLTDFSHDIKVSATGRIYDEDMIVLDMDYSGKASIGTVKYKVKDKDIKMVAYRN